GVLFPAIREVALLLLGGRGQIRNRVAVYDAVAGRSREQRAELGRTFARAVRQQVPVRRRQRLPYAAEVRFAVRELRGRGGARALRVRGRGEQGAEDEQNLRSDHRCLSVVCGLDLKDRAVRCELRAAGPGLL